jgi:hypothetical protein
MICASRIMRRADLRSLRRVEYLDRDQPVELAIFGEINRAHAAACELFDKRVLGRTEVRITDDGAQDDSTCRQKATSFDVDSEQRASFSTKLFVSRSDLAQLFQNDATKVATRGGQIVVDCRRLESEFFSE